MSNKDLLRLEQNSTGPFSGHLCNPGPKDVENVAIPYPLFSDPRVNRSLCPFLVVVKAEELLFQAFFSLTVLCAVFKDSLSFLSLRYQHPSTKLDCRA